jgi:predicted nuclease of restriction endonuclease-like (RecB) superfamily
MNKENLPSKTIEILFTEVKQIIEQARNTVYRTANFEMVQAHWNIGKRIVEEEQKGEERATYGKQLVKQLSKKLQAKYGKGYSTSNLWYMRQFYSNFKKIHAVSGELSWTHYRMLLKVYDDKARMYYMQEAIAQNWNTRTLERQINTQYYERILSNNPKEVPSIPVAKNELQIYQPKDVIKDPFLLEFLDIKPKEKILEKELEQALLNQLQSFLLELGKGFSFVERQYRFSTDTKHFYVDLVFYNYILKCFVLIDLKTTELTHKDIGQMDFYVRYFEDKVKLESDNPTIGIILCAEKDNTIAKYSLLNESKQIFASKYKTYLPTLKELEQEIERGRHQIELENKLNQKND